MNAIPDHRRLRRAIITGDLLRLENGPEGYRSPTTRNIGWLHAWLAPLLQECGLEVTRMAWDPTLLEPDHLFDTPRFYRAAGQELSLDGWAALCVMPTLPEAAQTMLAAPCADSIVIGYELPDPMRHILSQAGIPYIDVVLHAVRFLDDLVFALRSNLPEIHAYAVLHAWDESEAFRKAAWIRAKAAWMGEPLPLPPGAALVLGQVAHDRAMIGPQGEFHHLGEHLSKLHQLCCDHPQLLFKPHPYDMPNSPSQQAIRRLPAVRQVTHNYYQLLCQPGLEKVLAINSSGLHEAHYFGIEAEAWRPPLYCFGKEAGDAVAQDSRCFAANFWRGLFGLPARAGGDYLPQPNRIRRSMNADWGYGAIEKVCA